MSYPPGSMRPGDKKVPEPVPHVAVIDMLHTLSNALDAWVLGKRNARREERDFRKLQRKLARRYK